MFASRIFRFIPPMLIEMLLVVHCTFLSLLYKSQNTSPIVAFIFKRGTHNQCYQVFIQTRVRSQNKLLKVHVGAKLSCARETAVMGN